MTVERITVSLDSELADDLRRIANRASVPVSGLVADAVKAWIRGQLIDEWLDEWEDEFGEFDEAELQHLAADAGLPFLPRRRSRRPT